MQDVATEQAEAAAAKQAAQQAAAETGKKRAPSDSGPLASKRPRMASVQRLHTSAKADTDQARSASQSRSASHERHRSRSSSREVSSVQQQTPSDSTAQLLTGTDAGCDTLSKSQHEADALKAGASTDGKPDQHKVAAEPEKLETDANAAVKAAPLTDGKAAAALTEVKEYFVKWKNKSYIHCSWVKHDDVVKAAKVATGLNMRFKHYQRSVYDMPQVQVLEAL